MLVVGGEAAAENVGAARLPIINGTASGVEQDSVVLLAIKYQNRIVPSCSGTLVAKNLVLTARHCVGHLDEQDNVIDYPATDLYVFTGADATPKALRGDASAAQGRSVVNDGLTYLIPDIAFIVLDRPLSLPVAPVRLEGGATKGEELTVVGFGIDASNAQPANRMQRTGVSVMAVGPTQTKYHDVFSGEFAFGEAACSGDSGGPALDAKTRAVVGVASRVSNGKDRSDQDPSAFCVGSGTEDVYTSLATARAIAEKAFAEAGATPTLEPKSTPADAPKTTTGPAHDDSGRVRTPEASPHASGCATATSNAPHGSDLAIAIASVVAALALARRRRPQDA